MAAHDGAGATEMPVRLFVRLDFGDGRRLGPGKIALLEAVRAECSILGAARSLGMSYRRAWLLVDELDGMFQERVVATFPGRRGHGTELTAFGERLIALYRAVERQSGKASRAAAQEISAALAPAAAQAAAAAPAEPQRAKAR